MLPLLHRRSAASLGSLLFLSGCGPTPTSDAGMDAAVLDVGSTSDVPGDTALPGAALARERAAEASSTEAFCRCLAMRSATITEAACLAANEPDPDVVACVDRATGLVGSAFDAFYRCRAAAFDALASCYAGACSAAAATACAADFRTAATACRSSAPMDVTITQAYVDAYTACIVERVTGEMQGCPGDAKATSSAVGEAVFAGTTELAGNDAEPHAGCFTDPMSTMDALGSPDRAYPWVAPAAGSYRFDTVGSRFDTVLYLRHACSDDVDVACNDDIVLGTDQDSCVVVDAAEGEAFVVVVDGFGDLVRGDFVVNIVPEASCPVMLPDGGVLDAGPSDAGASDAGVDAGASDAGADAGPSDAG